jgi:hypothetical protein
MHQPSCVRNRKSHTIVESPFGIPSRYPGGLHGLTIRAARESVPAARPQAQLRRAGATLSARVIEDFLCASHRSGDAGDNPILPIDMRPPADQPCNDLREPDASLMAFVPTCSVQSRGSSRWSNVQPADMVRHRRTSLGQALGQSSTITRRTSAVLVASMIRTGIRSRRVGRSSRKGDSGRNRIAPTSSPGRVRSRTAGMKS